MSNFVDYLARYLNAGSNFTAEHAYWPQSSPLGDLSRQAAQMIAPFPDPAPDVKGQTPSPQETPPFPLEWINPGNVPITPMDAKHPATQTRTNVYPPSPMDDDEEPSLRGPQ